MLLKATISLSLAVMALALPSHQKRGVLKEQTYEEFQISDGVTGNALAEIQAKFPIDLKNPASVDTADLKIIEKAHDLAEKAEVDAFNPAIKSAKGNELAALRAGKTKNKVTKLFLEVAALQISGAHEKKDKSGKIEIEQKKLNKNVAADQANAGKPSKGVKLGKKKDD